jgi:hypothetical protein
MHYFNVYATARHAYILKLLVTDNIPQTSKMNIDKYTLYNFIMKRNMANGREVMSAEMGFIMPAVD